MNSVEIDTRIPLAPAAYAELAFTPAFDAFTLARTQSATLREHGTDGESCPIEPLVAALVRAHCAPQWAQWGASVRIAPDYCAGALLARLGGSVSSDAPIAGHDVGVRVFRVTPASRVAAALGWVLAAAGTGAGVHYDAVQFRFTPRPELLRADPGALPFVRFFMRAEALPALAVEGVATFAPDGTTGTLQRVRLAATSNSWLLDRAFAPLLDTLVRPDFAAMADAAAAWAEQKAAAAAVPNGGE